MKKITILVAALFVSSLSFAQVSSIVETGGVDAPVVFEGPTHQFAPCTSENPNDGTFENGFNCSSASAFQTANDVTVAAGENFTLSQITASIFANDGIALVDVIYYEDDGGLPGASIGDELGLVPTSQAVIGNNFGFDVNEIVLDLTDFLFAGDPDNDTTYWIELSVTDGTGSGSVFWVITTSTADGLPSAQLDGAWGIPDPAADGVAIWGGDCEPILGVGDNLAELVNIYPNPATTVLNVEVPADVEITDVALYDVLGKNTGASLVNGTINVSGLSRGVYILKMKSTKGTLTQKVIKR
ncbi:MAG: T9SS type A sorting domain-containing protein [Bacteroidota bacterium]